MYHLADSIAKLSPGRENWYIGREGIPVDDSSVYSVKKNLLGIKIEILESTHFPQHYGGNRKVMTLAILVRLLPREGAVATNDWCLRVYIYRFSFESKRIFNFIKYARFSSLSCPNCPWVFSVYLKTVLHVVESSLATFLCM